jgi:beta-lactamase regulating signal transducer with metallopeptidase domain
MIGLILDHLWQSTLFVAAAGLLTLFFRANGAGVRYGLWLSASLKFLFPLALLTASGTAISNLLPRELPPPPAMTALDGVAQPFSSGLGGIVQAKLVPVQPWDWTTTLAVIWLIGFFAIVTLWFCRWLNLRALARSAVPIAVDAPLPVRSSLSLLEPGLVGIFRPVLLLPAAITDQLSTRELDTVIAHELCHWRRRDNLTAALHMLVEALFWFHPLVWWLETRLIAERERACDEAVLAAGREPELYAQSILKVCKSYVQSPLTCVAGISGADLKPRLERIMRNRAALHLNLQKKALLTTVATIAVVAPLLAGLAGGRQALAQTSETLEGWGPFKFGMTPDQVLAAAPPDLSCGPYNDTARSLACRNSARGPIREFSSDFNTIYMSFGDDRHLYAVGPVYDHRVREPAESGAKFIDECGALYQKLQPAVEATYGSLAPLPQDIHGWIGATTVARDISGTGSRYEYTVRPKQNNFPIFGTHIDMKARRMFGERYVDLAAMINILDSSSYCLIALEFDEGDSRKFRHPHPSRPT